jgi:hypothetical protein
MIFGETVIYTEGGVEYEATVLGSRLLDDHNGSEEEPLLTLGFFKPVTRPGQDGKTPVTVGVIGTSEMSKLVQFRIDVAHESHQFSDEAKKQYHAVYGGTAIPQKDKTIKHVVTYPGGRWKEKEISTFTGSQMVVSEKLGE